MPHDLAPLLRMILSELRTIDASFAIVGGLAVAARTQPRFTKDVDFAVSVASDREAESILGSLHRRGFCMLQELDNRKTGRLATARLSAPPHAVDDQHTFDPVIDLLFAASGIEPETVAAASNDQVLPGLVVPTAQRPHLIAMKCVAAANPRRIHDRQDLVWLLTDLPQTDLICARNLLDLVNQRGCNPGHDLHALLDESIRLAAGDDWGPDFVPRPR